MVTSLQDEIRWVDSRQDTTSRNGPIILSHIELNEDWIPEKLSKVLCIERDENGTYIITDHGTTVYGDGDTALEALCDYVVSLIDYSELLTRNI